MAGRLFLPAILCGLAVASACGAAWGAAEVHLADDSLLSASSPPPLRQRPVLFVHGHNLDSGTDADFNYRKNWHLSLNNLPSFKQALDLQENAWLDLEPYYIRFQEQNRSIVEDAREIADAVERILARHDPTYTPSSPTASTSVKVALVAYSKGTISARLYLRSLHQQQYDLPPPRPGFNPVSEFVALSPPNHGLAAGAITALSLALKQLNNGYRDNCSTYLVDGLQSLDFIQSLNGHPIGDTMPPSPPDPSWTPGSYAQEAPGSRPNGEPVTAGTLYVTIYADSNRDLVGGSTPSTDCQGRVLARNLASDAVTIEVPEIPGSSSADVHQNTVHTPAVICLALHTVVHGRAPPSDFRCQVSGQVPRVPPRAAVVPVLDVSGSMLLPACNTCDPKLDVLKDAVELFVQLWAALAGPGDRIGATYFGSQVTRFPSSGDPLVELSTSNANALILDVRGQTTVPTNMTAMGGGLQRGVEALQGSAGGGIPQRHLILFSDGMQNVNPMVVRVDESPPPGAFHLEIANVPGRPPSNVSPVQPPLRLDSALGVKVHTVGVGASAPFLDLLTDIAQATGGTTKVTTAPDQDLRQYFVEEVIESLQGNSPHLVNYRRGVLGGPGAVERFQVGKAARRIVLKLSWRRKDRLSFRAEKDGVDVSDLGRLVEGPFYRIFALDLPAGSAGRRIRPEGEWQMRVSGREGTAYEAAAIVDEPSPRIQITRGRTVLAVGEPLELRMRISVDGRMPAGPTHVTATVLKPGDSAANLLALVRKPPERAGPPPEGADPAERTLHQLLLDDRMWRRLQPVPRTTTLSRSPDGDLRGRFTETTVPGAYRIVVAIQGNDPTLGEFRRTETLTALVRFGAADRAASQLQVTEAGRDPAGRHLRLSLKPKDRYGNHLGPGYAHRIRVFAASGAVASAPLDTSDGTYIVPLYAPPTSDPVIAVWVMDQLLAQGPLSGLDQGPRRDWKWWSATILLIVTALGIAWPLIGEKLLRFSR